MRKTDLLTTSQVAEILECDVRTVHRMVLSGRLEAIKLPGRTSPYLFTRDSVDAVRPTPRGGTDTTPTATATTRRSRIA